MAERGRVGVMEGRRAVRKCREGYSIMKHYQNNNLGLKSFIKERGMRKRRAVKAVEKKIKMPSKKTYFVFLCVCTWMWV